MELKRLAGILAHPTSFPGKYGIGDFGKCAFDFIDFLEKSDQRLWQILPLSPTSFGDSPYQSFSTFAGNTLLISPDELIEEGYIKGGIELKNFNKTSIDYGEVIEFKTSILREAFSNFKSAHSSHQNQTFVRFMEDNYYWLNDYALFISIKEYFIKERKGQGFSKEYKDFYEKAKDSMEENQINDYYFGGAWVSWPEYILHRDNTALKEYSKLLNDEIEYHKFLQYEFFRQWDKVKAYANKRNISIIGDLPIFIAFDSADCWANKELFCLDENGFPVDVAGVPPDYFSATGQLWGNPLYNWDIIEQTGYKWWIKRISKTYEMCEYIRIDHFRGFDTYWAVPFGEKTAENGEWREGPGTKLFDAIEENLGKLPIIAEDLGEMFESVYKLRDFYNLPGMKVLQFAFGDTPKNPFLPHNFEHTNCVVYTGTHDNDTSIGWFSKALEGEQDYTRRYMNSDGSNISWDLIRLAYSSIAAFAVIPLQDCLSLPTVARMNYPGTAEGNWKWRYTEGALNEGIINGLKYFVEVFNRSGDDITSINKAGV